GDTLVTDKPTVRIKLRLLSDANFLSLLQLHSDVLSSTVAEDRRSLENLIDSDDHRALFIFLLNFGTCGGLELLNLTVKNKSCLPGQLFRFSAIRHIFPPSDALLLCIRLIRRCGSKVEQNGRKLMPTDCGRPS